MGDVVAAALADTPASSWRTGQVIVLNAATGTLGVAVDGVAQPARWADPVVVSPGDAVLVAVVSAGFGQSEAIVICRLAAGPRPAEATVTAVPVGSPTITVADAAGVEYEAKFLTSYTPTVGDLVALTWQSSQPRVSGEVGSTTAPPPPPPPAPPPPPSTTGTLSCPATDSGTWNTTVGVWSQAHGQNVVQGFWSPYTYTGAWFYGTAPSQLAGRAITAVRFRLPSRRRIGNYNSAATWHLYLHTAATRGGEPSRVSGPIDYVAAPGYGGGDWLSLPTSWGEQIVAGGGIALAGSPYAGATGRGEDPESGTVHIDWRA